MTRAELEDQQALQRKALAEKHVQEWQEHNIANDKQKQQYGDSPALQAEFEKRAAAFSVRAGQETRDMNTTHAIEAERHDRVPTITENGPRDTGFLSNDTRNAEKNRDQRLQQQQQDVKQEYQQYMKEVEAVEKQERYNQNNLARNDAMEPAAEKRRQEEKNTPAPKMPEQQNIRPAGQAQEQSKETERERLKREFKEQIEMAKAKSKDHDRDR